MGMWAFSTKGSFASDQALHYTKMLRSNEKFLKAARKMKDENPNTTFLFELIGKDNQIVLSYDEDDIVFIGAVNKEDAKYLPTSDFTNAWNKDEGLNCAEVMKAKNLKEALALPDRDNREGVVVRIMSADPTKQMQVKFKQEDYKTMHRLLGAVSKRSMRRLITSSEATLSDLVAAGRTDDVRKIAEIDKAIGFYETGGTAMHKRLATDQRIAFNNVILPAARELARIKDEVDAISIAEFGNDQRAAMKSFFATVKDEDAFVKSQKLACFKARLVGSDWGGGPAKMLMMKMASGIKLDDGEGSAE